MQLPVCFSRGAGVLVGFVEVDRFAEAVKVRGAIWAAGKVFLQRTTLCGVHPFREILTEVRGHLFAFDLLALHAFMYPWSCSRRNIRARRSRDFTAGIDRRRIFAVSSALFPSISLKTKTMRYSMGRRGIAR